MDKKRKKMDNNTNNSKGVGERQNQILLAPYYTWCVPISVR